MVDHPPQYVAVHHVKNPDKVVKIIAVYKNDDRVEYDFRIEECECPYSKKFKPTEI